MLRFARSGGDNKHMITFSRSVYGLTPTMPIMKMRRRSSAVSIFIVTSFERCLDRTVLEPSVVAASTLVWRLDAWCYRGARVQGHATKIYDKVIAKQTSFICILDSSVVCACHSVFELGRTMPFDKSSGTVWVRSLGRFENRMRPSSRDDRRNGMH